MSYTDLASQGTTPETGQKKERKLIGDRGDHFLNRVQGETGENISACYQCERCTNACPVSHYMDIKPHQVMRHIQLGWREDLMKSSTIWICLSCEMCTTYCPNEVGVAETINHLRIRHSERKTLGGVPPYLPGGTPAVRPCERVLADERLQSETEHPERKNRVRTVCKRVLFRLDAAEKGPTSCGAPKVQGD